MLCTAACSLEVFTIFTVKLGGSSYRDAEEMGAWGLNALILKNCGMEVSSEKEAMSFFLLNMYKIKHM